MMDDPMDRTIDEAAAEYNRPPEAPREEMWRRIEAARREAAAGRNEAARPLGGSAAGVVLPFRRRAGRFAIPIAAAAVLALAFGLGRVSVDDPAPPAPRVATGSPPAASVPAGNPDSAAAIELAGDLPSGTDATGPTGATSVPGGEASDAGHPAGQPPRRQLGAPLDREAAEQRGRPDVAPRSDALALAAREHLAQAETFLVLFRASINSGQRVEPVVPATARYLLASNRLLIDSPAAEEPGMRRLLSDVELVLAQIAQMPADSGDTTDERLITDGIEQRDLLLRIRTAAGNARGMPNQGVL
jgi:hypothetical protein